MAAGEATYAKDAMDIEIPGIHHVTAITGDASGNVRFYTRVLGLRLVKKTVNQDDVSAYHLFYGDETGSPGTEVTFFDWPSTPPAIAGAGTIAPIALRVSSASALAWWAARLGELGVAHEPVEGPDGRSALRFADPEGQRLELVDDGGAPGGRPPADGPVPVEVAITGIADVVITTARPQGTVGLLTGVMGFRESRREDSAEGTSIHLETGAGGPGARVRVVVPREPRPGRPGAGGVHHVAYRTPDADQQRAWRERLVAAGLEVTPVIERYYFKSIYFREPGGALFEIATDGPGMTVDEPIDRLGQRLVLPPFLEPRRQEIEAGLRPIEAA